MAPFTLPTVNLNVIYFWSRFYIVILGIAFFSSPFIYFPYFIWLLFSFSIWTFISFLDFYYYFFIFNVCFIKTDTLYIGTTYLKCTRFNETDVISLFAQIVIWSWISPSFFLFAPCSILKIICFGFLVQMRKRNFDLKFTDLYLIANLPLHFSIIDD